MSAEDDFTPTSPTAFPSFCDVPYQPIATSEYLSTNFRRERRIECDCPAEFDEHGQPLSQPCGEECLNRLLFIECDPRRCKWGDLCSNTRLQTKTYPPLQVFKTEKKGNGVRSLSDLPANTLVIEYVGQVVDLSEFRKRTKTYSDQHLPHYYFMTLTPDHVIDATQKGNISRFINHSCDPNCETQKWISDGKCCIAIFTKRSISLGDELTFDYKYQRYGEEAQTCYCGASNCQGVIGGAKQVALKENDFDSYQKRKTKIHRPFSLLQRSGLLLEDTLEFCRAMLLAQEDDEKSDMLKILVDASDLALLKQFIHFQGIRQLKVWLSECDSPLFALQILRVLQKLPIRHRNVIDASKIIQTLEKLIQSRNKLSSSSITDASVQNHIQQGDISQEHSQPESSHSVAAVKQEVDNRSSEQQAQPDLKEETVVEDKSELEQADWDSVSRLGQELIDLWKSLPEEYRIPKLQKPLDRLAFSASSSPYSPSLASPRERNDLAELRKRARESNALQSSLPFKRIASSPASPSATVLVPLRRFSSSQDESNLTSPRAAPFSRQFSSADRDAPSYIVSSPSVALSVASPFSPSPLLQQQQSVPPPTASQFSMSHSVSNADSIASASPCEDTSTSMDGQQSALHRSSKTKDFKNKIAPIIIDALLPYRKDSCKRGRISSKDDFKYLAEKITKIVVEKEKKRVGDDGVLDFNDKISKKASQYVKEYMSQFGAVFQRF